MELTFFPNDYDFDEDDTPQKIVKPKPLAQTTFVKVRPRNHQIEQESQHQQSKENDLIFAFEENDQEESEPNQQLPRNHQLELSQIPAPQQHQQTIETAIQHESFTASIINESNISTITLDHKNLFVIERILFFPQKFFLYDKNQNVLISARKKLMQINSLFYFFSDVNMQSTKNNNYLGYMQSDSANQYRLFASNHTLLASFSYVIKKSTPGEINIRIGSQNPKPKKVQKQRTNHEQDGVFQLKNRQPQKNLQTGKYTTCLQGLGKIPSAKNVSIVYKLKNSLIMGKQKQKLYNLHYGQPWSDFIAFAFAISNYQEKDIQQ